MKLCEYFSMPVTEKWERPSDCMRTMGKAGEVHMGLCGQTMADLLARGESMMISRSVLRFFSKKPCPDRVMTRQIAVHGARAERLFQFYEGEAMVAECINEYFCVNLETRRVIRPEWFGKTGDPYTGTTALQRVSVPEEGELVSERVADEAFIDYNGHVNNTFYADFALETLGVDGFPGALYLQYLHEIMPHTVFSLYCNENRTIAFAKQGDQISFAATCEP